MLVEFNRPDGTRLNVHPSYVAGVLEPNAPDPSPGADDRNCVIIRMQNGRGYKTSVSYTDVCARLREAGGTLVEFTRPDGRRISVYPAHLSGVNQSNANPDVLVISFADGRGIKVYPINDSYVETLNLLGRTIDASPAPSTPRSAAQILPAPLPMQVLGVDEEDEEDDPLGDPDDEDY